MFCLKIGLDWLVASWFHKPYSVLYYVSPTDAPLLQPGDQLPYWLTMWAVALPFIAVGMWFTLRRLRDAGAPAWLSVLFFVPFANLIFFVACALLPSRPLPGSSEHDYRTAPPVPPKDKRMVTSVILASAAGAVVALGATGVSVGLLAEYGAALFLGAPSISGFFATLVFGRLHPLSVTGVVASTFGALMLSLVCLIAFAIEGLICLVMAAPLAVVASAFGAFLGYLVVAVSEKQGSRPQPASGLVALPIFLILEALNPMPPAPSEPVESTIVVDAPRDVVWQYVVAFPELEPSTDPILNLGIATPIGAYIEGEGVGAVRHCQFTTGEFIEPVTAWEPPRNLMFDVSEMPEPMFELNPWDIHPPHLDGYFETTQGQFLLEELPDGRTLVRGRTWYRVNMAPRAYWRWWADELIHRIHMRVLNHVKRTSERAKAESLILEDAR